MKKLLAFLLAAVLCLSLVACGDDAGNQAAGEKNKASGDGWVVNSEGVLIVSEAPDGKIPSYTYSEPAPWYTYRMLIKSIKVEEGITHIGKLAFHSMEVAESVELPSTLLQIADKSFTFCKSLKSITLPNSVVYVGESVFQGCTALKTVVWSEGAGNIPKQTFLSCSSLTQVTLPEGIRSISNGAFSDCTNLKTITLPDSLQTFERDSFENCSSLVLQFKDGSAAEKMAEEHGVPYEIID